MQKVCKRLILTSKYISLMLPVLAFPVVAATTYHVSKTGNDNTTAGPFLTINKVAQVAQAGDSIIIHAGVYREWVQPARGGSSATTRITIRLPWKCTIRFFIMAEKC